MKLWSCNFNSQLANALVIEGDYRSSLAALERGYMCASEICPELQVCGPLKKKLNFVCIL